MKDQEEGKVALSVIVVAWQSRHEIGPCLESIPAELDGRPVEILVVDNSLNVDGTGNYIENHFPCVRVIQPEVNLGFGSGNNLGIRQSTGEVVLILNPDTIVNVEALAHCLRRLTEDPGIGLISPRLLLADGSMDLACRRQIPSLWDGFCRAAGLADCFPQSRRFAGYNLTYLNPDDTYDVGAINGAFMMGRRVTLETIGLFDETFFMYGDDLDLCYRCSHSGYRVVYDGRVSIVHLKGTSVAKDYDRMSKAIFDANKAFYLKHFNPRGSRFVRLKYDLAFGAWKIASRIRAKCSGRRRVQPG